jgi:putative phosphoesterase
MKIAVLSDIHDHIDNLDSALSKVKSEGCESVIFCGDFCSPFILLKLLSANLHIYSVFGNNDGDLSSFYKLNKPELIEFCGPSEEFGEVTIDNNKIAFCHYPKMGRLLARSGEYQAVFHGHTHQAYEEHLGNTLLANPGSVCGIINGKYGSASFGVYDTSSRKFDLVYLGT